MKYDIFISYKRKSLPTANNLYYRLTTKGYSTFFDLEEMRRDNFDTQLLQHIENANDIFVLLEEGSLDGCKKDNWKEEDWFCHEIAFALEKKKNIIPVLLNGFVMPDQKELPEELKELTLKNAPEFSYSFFDEYIDKLISKEYITSKAIFQNAVTSIFKFYSNEDCQVIKEGKLACSIAGGSDEPFYLPVYRKGTYRFKCINTNTSEELIKKESIDSNEEKEVEIKWTHTPIIKDRFTITLGNECFFDMIRVPLGTFSMGATPEQSEPDDDEFPVHIVKISKDYYLGQTPVTHALWNAVMGTSKSRAEEPVTEVSWKDCQEFIKNLNQKTGLLFRLPTEAEWEYAARGGNKSQKYPFSGSNIPNKVAWYYENSNGHKHTVKQKNPNELGLYDMSGNVMELCQDWYATYEEGMQVDPQGPNEGYEKVMRGGSWDDGATMCGTSARDHVRPDESDDNIGFRLALTIVD